MRMASSTLPLTKSPLGALPPELFDLVASHLDACDFASLRLASRILDDKVASQRRYADLFATAAILLDISELEDFVQVTQGRMCHLLQHVTIAGMAQERVPVSHSVSARHQQLLTDAFANIKTNSSNGGIATLCLKVTARAKGSEGRLAQPPEFGSWRAVWDAARFTFKTTMLALNQSQLRIDQELDIFSSVKGCSLAFDDFLDMSRVYSSIGNVFSRLKTIKLSLAAPKEAVPRAVSENVYSRTRSQESAHVVGPKVYPADILRRIAQVVSKLMPSVDDVDWHWFNLTFGTPELSSSRSASPCIHEEIRKGKMPANALPFEPMECKLRGLYVSERDLLRFLKNACPERLTLQYVHLIEGSWEPIFQYLTSEGCRAKYYHLDDITLSTVIVHVSGPDLPKFPMSGNGGWPSTLTRQGNQLKKAIKHRLASSFQGSIQSPLRAHWQRQVGYEFGPIGSQVKVLGRYDFVKLNKPLSRGQLRTQEGLQRRREWIFGVSDAVV